MRFSQLLQLVTLSTALLFARSTLASTDDPDVTVLTDSNFDDFINQDLALVEFYAPWCGHCKSLAPEYALAATDLKSNDPPIALGKVDSTEQQALSGKFDVKGYPTLKVFRNGKATDYNGPRKRDGIVAYMKKQGGPAAKPITSKAEAEALYKQDPVASYAIIGVFGDDDKSKPSQLSSSFTLLANRLRDEYFFGKIVGNSALAKELYNIDGEGIVAVLQGEPRVYSGDSKQSNVEQFIRANSVPLIGQLTQGTQDTYTKRNLPIVKLFMKVDKAGLQSKQMKYYINRLKKVAEKYSEQLSFVIADKGEHQSHMTSVYNAQPPDHYLLVVDDITKGKQYKFDDSTSKFDAKAYGQFIDDFVGGKLQAYVKSEAEPADNNGPVKVLTGKNFESLVTDDKDVFLEFYAPWCGHCKTLAPKYEELGKKLADQSDVVIAKLDATANDFPRPPYEVAGYPTLYFKPAGGSPMKYEGGREVTDMLKFVKKNGTKYVGGKSKSKKGVSDDEKEL